MRFGNIKISGKEPKETDFDWEEIQGFDKENSEKAAHETIERIKNELN